MLDLSMMENITSFGKTDTLFLHLLRCGVTGEEPCADLFPISEEEWSAVWQTAQQQAVSAVVFSAVRRLSQELRPDRQKVFLPWLSETSDITMTNERLFQTCQNICQRFRKAGFHACILKGQGVAQLYPDPLLRQSGDIDVWLWPVAVTLGTTASLRCRRKLIMNYVRRVCPQVRSVYHHVDFNVLKHTDMELHFTPTWMNSPLRNRWLQRWFERQAARQFQEVEDGFCAPTAAFNAVYLLLHIYRHLFAEGIGLRQLTDYFQLLQSWHPSPQEVADVNATLRKLGVSRFAGALMYVMERVFGLEKSAMLCMPREEEGMQLLDEVMLAGNFGHSDTRFTHYADGTLGAFLTRTRRNLRFLYYYPSEVLWSPVWKLTHWLRMKFY